MEASGIRFAEREDFLRSILCLKSGNAETGHRVCRMWRKTLDVINTYPTGYQVKYCCALMLGIRLLRHFLS
jgi:hypothetical protein